MTPPRREGGTAAGASRRELLARAGAGLAAALLPDSACGIEDGFGPSLRDLGRAKGIEVGTAFSGSADARYRALLRHHVGLITPEWCLKPGFLKPSAAGPYRFAEADATYIFAREAGLAVHGHTLFWHGDPLAWAGDPDPAVVTRRYRDFVRAVVTRYPETASWDVANEIVAETGPLFRPQPGFPLQDIRFVAGLFREAATLAPGRPLCLNDYNLECGAPWCADKQARALQVVDALLAQGAPINVVGFQGHLSSRHGLAPERTRTLVRRLADRGLDVHLSELDVNDVTFADDVAERDRRVADLYHACLRSLLEEPTVRRVTFWGLADIDHWMVREQIEDARPAGLSRPALFDRDLRPKPAFLAVADAFRTAPRRP